MAINDIPLFFNISIGVAIEKVKDLVPSEFFIKAKLASMMAGEKDRDYSFYQPGAAEWTRDAQIVLGDIPKAVEKNEFDLYYQPIIDIDSSRIIGMEALIRWHHKTLGGPASGQFPAHLREYVVDLYYSRLGDESRHSAAQ
jgi:predicted signal transduction protein with EAL and GGDEF domain